MSIEDNLENSKEQLIRNIDLLNDSINRNSNEIDKNKLIVLLIEKYNINPFANMKVLSWAEPYVHQNAAELINNLVQAVGGGFLSRESASELSGYGRNNEWDRIMREKKEEQSADLLYQLKSQQQTAKISEENKDETTNE